MPVKRDMTMSWTSDAETARFRAAMEMHARKQLAAKTIESRKRKGWSNEELAHQAGVSTRTISRIETASIKDPKDETLRRVAKALGQSFEDYAGPRITTELVEEARKTQMDELQQELAELRAENRRVLSSLQKLLEQGEPPRRRLNKDEPPPEEGGEEEAS